MSRGNFPQQAIATRRQTALLSHRTYTTERRALFDAILRLSFDLNRETAPVPSQAWLARIIGIPKSDVCRAERALVGFGMLKVDVAGRGPDKRRLYTPRPDTNSWGGEGFAWRIADPQARALALLAECQLATCEGPEAPEQPKLALVFTPTAAEEFNLEVQVAHVEAAIEAAGGLPATESSAPWQHLKAHIAPPEQWRAIKARLGSSGGVGHPANDPGAEPSSALAAQPAQGERTLARQPTLPGSGSPGNPSSEGSALAGQPTTGASEGVPEPSGGRGVGRVANEASGQTLATRPTNDQNVGYPANEPEPKSLATRPTNPPAHPRARVRDIKHYPSTSIPSGEINLTSYINGPETAASGGMRNVAGAAQGMEDVSARAPDELLRMIFDVVRADSARLINHWRRLLGPKPRQGLAIDLLGEIKIRADETRSGRGKPIANPGAWFVSEFYKRAGIPRAGKTRTKGPA